MGEVRRSFSEEEFKELQEYYGSDIMLLNDAGESIQSGEFSGSLNIDVYIKWSTDGFTSTQKWDFLDGFYPFERFAQEDSLYDWLTTEADPTTVFQLWMQISNYSGGFGCTRRSVS